MGKKFRNLYHKIYEWDNLLTAYHEARRGKTYSSSYLRFKQDHLYRLRLLQQELIEQRWKPNGQLQFEITDPKRRLISCHSFRDRVVHHALVQVVGPILDDALMPQTYACRYGKGTHRCAKQAQRLLRQNKDKWVLHIDFAKFFPSVPTDLLLALLSKKITCASTLALIESILSIQEQGIPIGALTSQVFSNYWGGQLDRYMAALTAGRFVRYMDDMLIIADNKEDGLLLKDKASSFVRDVMGQVIGKWSLRPVKRGVTFCGYRLRIRYKLIKKQSMVRHKRRLQMALRHGDHEYWRNSQVSFSGHLSHADGYNGLKAMGLALP